MSPTSCRRPTPTGIELLDEQHEVLYRMIVEIAEAFERGDRDACLVERLSSFYQYVQIHFEAEESLMRRYAPQCMASHEHAHQELRRALRSAIVDYKRRGSRVPHSVLDVLEGFTRHHTDTQDVTDLATVREAMHRETSRDLDRESN